MLVLDANILIRAVLGSRVLALLRKYAGQVEFMAPDVAFQEAREQSAGNLGGAEDSGFFGCGVATWTTDRVELYLAKAAEREA